MVVRRDAQAQAQRFRGEGVAIFQHVRSGRCRHGGETRRSPTKPPARRRDRASCRRNGILPRPPRRGDCKDVGAIRDQVAIVRAGAIPFEHGEFGMVQSCPLTVAKDMGERENPGFAGRQQFLAVEFRRRMQVEFLRDAAGRGKLRGETGDVGFVAGRNLQGGGLDFRENRVRRRRRATPRRCAPAGAGAGGGRRENLRPRRDSAGACGFSLAFATNDWHCGAG